MAHNIATINGKAAFFGTEKAWHGLGQVARGAKNWQDAMRLAQLDWTVSKRQLEWNGKPIPCYGIFRDDNDTFLGAVGEVYQEFQNHEAFEFVDALLEAENGCHYETAGALGDGSRIWCMAAVPQADFDIGGIGDEHKTYLVFTTSHDGHYAHHAFVTTTRVACQNTLQFALNADGKASAFKAKRSKLAKSRMKDAGALVSGAVVSANTLRQKLTDLAERRITRESMQAVFDRLFPAPEKNQTRRDNILADILALYEENDGDAFPQIRGTAFNLLNAITAHTDHRRAVRASGGDVEVKRAESAIFGQGSDVKAEALEVIYEVTASDPYQRLTRRYSVADTQADFGEARRQEGAGLLEAILAAGPRN